MPGAGLHEATHRATMNDVPAGATAQDATSLPTDVATPAYQIGDASVPMVQGTAARDASGGITLALVNLPSANAGHASRGAVGGSRGKAAQDDRRRPTSEGVLLGQTDSKRTVGKNVCSRPRSDGSLV
jgi:hypothetical protein